MFSSPEDMLSFIDKNSVKFVDFRFTNTLGSCCHKTCKAEAVNPSMLLSGIALNSSSTFNSWCLLPDISTAFLDPFCAQSTLIIFCDVVDNKQDPRSTAKRAHEYMLETGIANKAHFGPEVGFYIFDDVKYHIGMYSSYFKLDSIGENYNLGKKNGSESYEREHKVKNIPVPPIDLLHDLRSEILEMMGEVGIKPLFHHLETTPSQCSIKFEHDEFLRSSDNVQKFKYVVHNVAHSYGKSATFMPKPIKEGSGSGMYCNQSLWKDGVNLFSDQNDEASEICLYYVGGIIKHGQAINAYTNPTTNSYKRNKTLLTYSYSNPFSAIYIPNKVKRVKVCFPDALANPYFCFAVQLMAGLDGIQNKIHPGKALEELAGCEKKTVSRSLHNALEALDNDREFLLKGGVFTNEQINDYIKIKAAEVEDYESSPHPIEFVNYYNL